MWELVPKPSNQFIIRTKWTFRNKVDEYKIIVRSKVILVIKYYNNNKKSIDYEKAFALVAILESIRMLLAFSYNTNFTFFQIDVKSDVLKIKRVKKG